MHIPDGFLDAKTWISLSVVSAGLVCYSAGAINKNIVKDSENEKRIPLMGVMAAFIFAAQMLNFPVAGGTSGHFMGGVLAAVLLGPLTGLLILSAVLIVQCFVFQDGGLTALGANIFNMGLVGSFAGYYIYFAGEKILGRIVPKFASAFIAGWVSIVLAASFCAVELAVSGTVPLGTALPAMAGVHALIGIGEGLVTVAALGFINKTRPDLLKLHKI